VSQLPVIVQTEPCLFIGSWQLQRSSFQQMHTTSCMFPLYVRSMVVGSTRDQGIRQRQSQSPESVAPNVRVRNPMRQSQSPVNTSTGCRETRKRRQRVRTESQSPLGSQEEDQGIRRKTGSQQQRVGHPWKLSIYLPTYLSVCLSIYPSIHLSILVYLSNLI